MDNDDDGARKSDAGAAALVPNGARPKSIDLLAYPPLPPPTFLFSLETGCAYALLFFLLLLEEKNI